MVDFRKSWDLANVLAVSTFERLIANIISEFYVSVAVDRAAAPSGAGWAARYCRESAASLYMLNCPVMGQMPCLPLIFKGGHGGVPTSSDLQSKTHRPAFSGFFDQNYCVQRPTQTTDILGHAVAR